MCDVKGPTDDHGCTATAWQVADTSMNGGGWCGGAGSDAPGGHSMCRVLCSGCFVTGVLDVLWLTLLGV
jgi:hypothetical protein